MNDLDPPCDVTRSSVVTHAPQAVFVETDGAGVILDGSDGEVHHLNGTAALVWKFLDGSCTLGELAADFTVALDAPHDDVLRDVLDIVEQFLDARIAVPVDPTPHR
jgi:hypothetical protein